MLGLMHEHRHAIAEDREQRANRDGDRAHRPHVHPYRHAKCRRRRRRNRPAEPGNDAHAQQEERRADWEAFDPPRQARKIKVEIHHARGVRVDRIAEERRDNQTDCINNRSFKRSEDGAIHDRKRVSHGERRRRHDRENGNGQDHRERPETPQQVLDVRLFGNDESREQKRSREEGQSGQSLDDWVVQVEGDGVRVLITVLCGVGLYASLFMLAKTRRAERGELTESSVVQTSRARLLGGIPNAAFGVAYYLLLGIAIWFARTPLEGGLLAIAALAAAVMSAVLAYSLLFVTRMPCPYCWTSHAINGVLAIVTILDFFKISYWQ